MEVEYGTQGRVGSTGVPRYLCADGMTPRKSDGLIYERGDPADVVHLERAAEFGYRDDLAPLDEVEALTPLRGDPRFARILERVR